MPRFKKKKDTVETIKNSNWPFFVIIILLTIQTIFLFYKNLDFMKDAIKVDPNLSYASEVEQKKITVATNEKNEFNSINPKNIRVSILNGCGTPGIASDWKERLRALNYDVRETGNSSKKYSKTIILSRIENMSFAKYLAKSLGISEDNVIMQINKDLVDIDLTLIVGSDHTELKNR